MPMLKWCYKRANYHNNNYQLCNSNIIRKVDQNLINTKTLWTLEVAWQQTCKVITLTIISGNTVRLLQIIVMHYQMHILLNIPINNSSNINNQMVLWNRSTVSFSKVLIIMAVVQQLNLLTQKVAIFQQHNLLPIKHHYLNIELS